LAIPTRVPLDALPSSTSFEIGLRPDAIALAPPESGDAAAIVDLVERLGDRAHVYARLADGAKVVCDNTAQVTLKPGDTVGLRFTGGEAHLFDASGRAHHADAR
jgi:multiple sugar transport system ATP-binding protein